MTAPALSFANVTLGYDRHPVVHHLTGQVPSGSLLALCGPNGGGKSTLLKAIVGVLRPMQGRLAIADRRQIAYLPQVADLDRGYPITVYDLVAMGLWRQVGLFGGIGRRERARVEGALHAVGLTGFEGRSLGALSGGQVQRALFARLMLQDAPLILLDEPFTAIDAATTADLLDLVRRWHAEARTIVAVLHDHDLVRRTFPETLLLAREVVAWGPTASVLTHDHLTRARAMAEAPDPHAQPCSRAA